MKKESRIKAGIIGATGMVGQYFVKLLEKHPLFEVAYLAASPSSAGKKYGEAVAGRWHMDSPIPISVKDLPVGDASNMEAAKGKCEIVFCAVDMEKDKIIALEHAYAANGFPVISNNSANRQTADVPMIIPEINPSHLNIISAQRKNRGNGKGFIVVKPNCSIQSYMIPIYALEEAGYEVGQLLVTTMQAVSGAGFPGVPSLNILGNVVPYIRGENEKTELEPLKIFGSIRSGKIRNTTDLRISARCTRVPVMNGHMASVSIGFKGESPNPDEVIKIWSEFKSVPQKMRLPSAPAQAIICRDEPDRPQPFKDCDAGSGMAISVGGLRWCSVLGLSFVGLSHNMVRGAAGGGILTAELLEKKGYFR